MTSFRQIEANRRNGRKSTGPITEEGKQRSRRNAVRHGLTAETVIGALENAKDYKAFEASIIADYDAQSTVERELVLRLASLLWRLRRATSIETGLFENQANHLSDFRQARQALPSSRAVYAMFGRADSTSHDRDLASHGITNATESVQTAGPNPVALIVDPTVDLTRCFLRLAVKADADRFAKNVVPIIREIQSSGVASHRAVARSLNARGVATARGGQWTAVQVSSILRRVLADVRY